MSQSQDGVVWVAPRSPVLDEQGVWESGAADRVHFINDGSHIHQGEPREKHRFERVTKCKDEDGVVWSRRLAAFRGIDLCRNKTFVCGDREFKSLFTWAGFEYDYTVVNKKNSWSVFAGAIHPRLGEVPR